jgi:hypothetical protein
MAKKAKGLVEESDKLSDDSESGFDDIDIEEDDASSDIWQNDIAVEGGIFDEDQDEVEEVSGGLDIGSTILSSASPVESWRGQNLEETISRERVEKDWGDEEEFVSGDFYKSSTPGDNFYGGGLNDVYSSSRRGNNAYETIESGYDLGKPKDAYAAMEVGGARGSKKSYGQIRDDRGVGGSSALENMGIQDRDMDRKREIRSRVVRRDNGEA